MWGGDVLSFYTSISKYYDYIFPLKNDKVNFVLDRVQKNQIILDIGCSTGELTRRLNEYGHWAVGIDIDADMIDIAKGYETENLAYYVIDMLDIDEKFSDTEFNQIICFGNTLVHLNSKEEILNFFKKVKSLLKRQGKFKFQIINYDKVLNEKLQGLPTIENDKIKFVRKYKLINGFIQFNTNLIIKYENREIENSIMLLPIRKDEIITLLTKAGFEEIDIFSSFNRDPWDIKKLPLVIEAE